MKKELPKIYKGKVNNINNQKMTTLNNYETKEEININRQIKDIFSSSKFVYKSDTIITLKTGEIINKTIIGKNNNSLITIDGDLLDISSIEKIELA